MKKETFLKRYGLTEAQYSGAEKIEGDLYLSSVTAIPEGFNPTVGGDLYLRSVTAIPEGFNPTVGGSLDLSSVTAIPEGFNPTVGGSLYLRSVTAIPEGFNPTVGGSLDLRSVIAIPEGFNPTVGGSLYLSSVTAIPEGFNPTVGGDLDLRSRRQYIGATVPEIPEVRVNRNFFWDVKEKRYAKIDGIFCEITGERPNKINDVIYTVYSGKKVNRDENFYIVNNGTFYAHGTELAKAFEDLQFKMVADKLKKEPINPDTIVSVNHYRLVTGACQMGCNSWLAENNLSGVTEMKASELLPLLKKTNAYGYERFKKLVTF